MAEPEPTVASASQRTYVFRNAALAGAIACPLVMLLPPRKLDLRNFFLAGVFFMSTNHLAQEYTGTSLVQRFSNRVSSVTHVGLPEKAQRTSEILREAREREAALKGIQSQYTKPEDKTITGAAKKVWLGGESQDWGKQRNLEHQKALEEGQGIGDIIMGQVRDVLAGDWGSKAKENDLKEASSKEEKKS